ncbi:hypothetical protein HG441_002800 [Candidatus Saccharibacteria bacterium]|nr:hypothetical protein [Candidatus Saccharibacteria bacterium]
MLENNLKNLIKNYQPNQAASDVVQRTKIVLLVGISGAGKDTVKRRMLEKITSLLTSCPTPRGSRGKTLAYWKHRVLIIILLMRRRR